MINKKWRKALQPKNVVLATVLAVAGVSAVAQNLPDLGLTSGDPWNADLYYENHTALRDKAGLSKFRNTLQSEMSKNLNDGWRFRGIFRATYDGVYDLNDKEYGKNAGGSVQMGNSLAPLAFAGTPFAATPYANPTSAYGDGAVNHTNATLLGLPPTNTFYNPIGSSAPAYAANNANVGLQVLGAGWHTANGAGTGCFDHFPCSAAGAGCDGGGFPAGVKHSNAGCS